MLCLGILWNTMEKNFEDALKTISTYGEIVETFSMDLGNEYESFVRDIYLHDGIAKWKVNKKIESMFQCSNSRKIMIVIINIDTSEIVYHELKNKNVFVNLENMKVDIRKKYSKLIDFYIFDNVFHATDDAKEYKAALLVVKEYIKKGIDYEYIDLEKSEIKVLKKTKS